MSQKALKRTALKSAVNAQTSPEKRQELHGLLGVASKRGNERIREITPRSNVSPCVQGTTPFGFACICVSNCMHAPIWASVRCTIFARQYGSLP
eukprot:CAMPEP_0171102252 /NCGR_PEP_ID=MMETSP0766_2-20121228/57286_1 /TAXON_ID=439317 /ORGANISM="Gambierdiscus australes, Strain CAWD 149" /LENGTH=93 /DNA_ID=CAMNT_0011562493 /DNA_START=18 /DNA_END=295 /DNA_ORIENTATION=+